MFHWLTDRRRKKLNETPFPALWEKIIRRNVAHYCMLEDNERSHLRALIQVFIAEKNWLGAGGLELSDEIQVTISAQACLLLLGLAHNFYENVESIIVYPSTVVPPRRKPGFFENTVTPVEFEQPIIGQAIMRGPVIIVWDAAIPNPVAMLPTMNLPINWTCSTELPTARRLCAIEPNTVTESRPVRENICV